MDRYKIPEYKTLYRNKRIIPLVGENGKIARFELFFNNRFIFGMGPNMRLLNIAVSLITIAILLVFRLRDPDVGHPFAWVCILAGATGNLIDKLFLKSLISGDWVFSLTPRPDHVIGVVDFISVIWFGMRELDFFTLNFLSWSRWPYFNLADMMITSGTVLLIISLTNISSYFIHHRVTEDAEHF